MRWRLFTRAMLSDSAKINFALWLTGRITILCFAVFVAGISAFLAYIGCDSDGAKLPGIFVFVMLGWQAIGLLRDPQNGGVEAELLRFPLRLRTYIGLWLSAGALDGVTILGTWACFGLWIGLLLGHANPVRATLAVALFLACNLMLSRTIVLWMGRMLARRRTRELVLVLFSVIGIVPRLLRNAWVQIAEYLHRLPLPPIVFRTVHALPPSLAAHTAFGNSGFVLQFAGLLLWDVALASALILGLRRSFRGEHLQEFAASSEPKRLAARNTRTARATYATHPAFLVVQMEWARLRHSGMVLYATFTPLIYVVILGTHVARTPIGLWTLPIAAAYMGVVGLRSFNVFGADGPGVQTFMLSPIPLRQVMLGKNLFAALIYVAQLAACTLVVALVVHRISVPALLFTLVWAAGHMAMSFTIGNTRSITTPIRVATNGVALRRNQRGGGGGWIALLCIFAASLVGGIIVVACTWSHHPWLAPLAMLPFTAAAIVWYRRTLDRPMFYGDIEAMEPLGLIVAKTA
jgi:ABC-2 type transport system permease protein